VLKMSIVDDLSIGKKSFYRKNRFYPTELKLNSKTFIDLYKDYCIFNGKIAIESFGDMPYNGCKIIIDDSVDKFEFSGGIDIWN
jgi:hypothetical protein